VRPDGSPFSVLTVCSGNICRSPLAEQLLASRLGDGPFTFAVSSAGTIADDGDVMDETAAEQSRRRGGSPDGHRSRLLRAGFVAESHLVLTATRAHRAEVVKLLPRASRFTFTLNQFARLVAAVDPADRAAWQAPEDVVAAAAAMRGVVVPLDDEGDDDIVDPYRRGPEVHDEAAGAIDDDVAVIVSAFAALQPHGGAGR
jgi:protein-tyrosine phosphatase